MITSRLMTSLLLALAVSSVSAAETTKKTKPTAKTPDKPAATVQTEKGRDWTSIDKNKDGYISPDEMESWLQANPGPQK